MPDFLKTLYAFPFMAAAYIWLSLAGFFAYPYFLLTGFKEEQMRSFLYMAGKTVQTAIFFASLFNKKIKKKPFPDAPCVLVANHPCAYDTFMFFDFGVKNLICVAKGWPFKIPFYGTYIKKAGYINSDGKTSEEIIKLASQKLKAGFHVGIFPEGTRQSKIGRFRSLAFAISIHSGAKVLPFAIKGLDKMLPARKWFPKCARVEYVQLDAVSPDGFKGGAGDLKMAQHVKNLIAQELDKNDGAQNFDIQKVMFHRPPMLLADKILEENGKNGKVSFKIKKECLFLDDKGFIMRPALVEIAAQSVAAIDGYQKLQKKVSALKGMLVSVREFKFFGGAKLGDEVICEIEKSDELANLHIVNAKIAVDNVVKAEGELRIFDIADKI